MKDQTCETCRRFLLCVAEGAYSPCELWHPVKNNNGDRIRTMSNEELAHWLVTVYAAGPGGCCLANEWLDWLNKEADE